MNVQYFLLVLLKKKSKILNFDLRNQKNTRICKPLFQNELIFSVVSSKK